MGRKKSVLTLINEAAADNEHNVIVLPLMCGTGKSSAISEIIRESIQHKSGILIVTDRTSRFDEYLSPRDDELKAYIQKKRKSIAALTSKNIMKEGLFHYNYTVLMMTIQRYRSLTQEKLLEYLHWNKGQRKLVLFDEKPFLYFQYQLDLNAVNKFEAAFVLGINSKEKFDEKSKWLMDYWAYRKMAFLTSLAKSERLYSRPNSVSILDGIDIPIEDEALIEISPDMSETQKEYINDINNQTYNQVIRPREFEQFIIENKDSLYKFNKCDAVSFLRAFLPLPYRSRLYSFRSKESGEYKSYYTIVESEQSKYQNIPAKCVILDGTADLSMDYNANWIYVDTEVAKPYIRKMPNLKLILVNEATSKKTLLSRDAKRLSRFINYVKKESLKNDVCIFTYKDILQVYQADMDGDDELTTENRYDYMGNLKGRNDFQTHTVFGQVGIFQLPSSYYLSLYLAQHPTLKESLLDNPRCAEILDELTKNPDYQSAMYKDILADIEQNIFRSPIRSPAFTGEVQYYLFFDYDVHSILKDLIIQRFREQYGAEVVLKGAIYEFGIEKTMSRKTRDGKPSKSQRFIIAKDNTPNGDYQINEWLNMHGFSKADFNSAKQCNMAIKEMFESICIDKHKGIYRFK